MRIRNAIVSLLAVPAALLALAAAPVSASVAGPNGDQYACWQQSGNCTFYSKADGRLEVRSGGVSFTRFGTITGGRLEQANTHVCLEVASVGTSIQEVACGSSPQQVFHFSGGLWVSNFTGKCVAVNEILGQLVVVNDGGCSSGQTWRWLG